ALRAGIVELRYVGSIVHWYLRFGRLPPPHVKLQYHYTTFSRRPRNIFSLFSPPQKALRVIPPEVLSVAGHLGEGYEMTAVEPSRFRRDDRNSNGEPAPG
ncbi:MAG: hypothetical protein ILO36_08430, partial [Abditibacteriota bacterium]|nr:hypothetical protein [Abditibacteriota bacterium]